LLVATQVVEVSLNIDFHQAFFDPSPIDALVQRMGRVNRSGGRPPARVVIMREQVNPHALYDTNRVERTIDELSHLDNPISENDLVDVADRIYGAGYQAEELDRFESALHHQDLENIEEQLIAGTHQEWIDKVIDNSDGHVEVLPKKWENRYKKLFEDGLWLEANTLLVPLRVSSLSYIRRLNRVNKSVDPWIVDCPYTEQIGLDLTIEKELD
jgi:CRISPR-associated endonuclease/helicase Cas3